MHEAGVISGMLKTVESVMAANDLTTVETIVLEVGELSGVIPHYMETCYPAAVFETPFENTKLKINVIPGIVRCNRCGREFNGMKENLTCPFCRETEDLTPLTGQELVISQIIGS